jgi:hypothetical protein
MDIKATLGKLPGWIGKYRYPILVLAICGGVGLLAGTIGII